MTDISNNPGMKIDLIERRILVNNRFYKDKSIYESIYFDDIKIVKVSSYKGNPIYVHISSQSSREPYRIIHNREDEDGITKEVFVNYTCQLGDMEQVERIKEEIIDLMNDYKNNVAC